MNVDLAGGNSEEYLITFPKLRIDGLWYGSPYIELTETSNIVGSNGWAASVSSSIVSIFYCRGLTLGFRRSNMKEKVTFPERHTHSALLYRHRPTPAGTLMS